MIDQEKASRLARAGFDLWQAGQLEESAEKYREALECANPEHYALEDYHGEFAAVLATLGRNDEARVQYELALATALRQDAAESGPGVAVARYFLGEHLLKMDDPARALGVVQGLSGVQSKQDWLLRIVEAKALWVIGRIEEALASATSAVSLAPNDKVRQNIREDLAFILGAER
jgi:tetratricopeptide (TPR) repeat protein